jgi:NAD(P)-dependent dehydrogenase (short-subunit alcohol dehydrogenase family)
MSDQQRVAVVTGANGGIGLETARGLATLGFHVVLLCRNPQRADAAVAEIRSALPDASLATVIADLGVQADVRRAATEIEEQVDRLDVLVNNAGVQLRKTARTSEDHDVLLAINHLGPFLLTNLLLPLLERCAPARIVTVASDVHRIGRVHLDTIDHPRNYGLLGMTGYGATKLMNILFTRELAHRLDGTGVTANCLHPGAVSTNLGNPPKVLQALIRPAFRTPEDGAKTSLYVAHDATLDGVSGHYFANSKLADGKLSTQARDDELARRLWQRSAELVGLVT